MSVVSDIPVQLAPYLDRLVATLRETTDLEAAYLIGSGVAGDLLERRMPEVLAAVTPGR